MNRSLNLEGPLPSSPADPLSMLKTLLKPPILWKAFPAPHPLSPQTLWFMSMDGVAHATLRLLVYTGRWVPVRLCFCRSKCLVSNTVLLRVVHSLSAQPPGALRCS